MSCTKCDLHKGGFHTEDEFSKFEEKIAALIESGQLTELGKKPKSRFFEVSYKCNSCDSIWTLSFPDQAYRGSWNEE